MKDKTFIARGLLAGICISMGGCIYLKVGGVAGAILFAFGLITVVTLQLNLFTGKAQFVWGRGSDGQYAQGGYIWLLSILALNIIGCLVMGLLMGSTDMQEAALSIVDKKAFGVAAKERVACRWLRIHHDSGCAGHGKREMAAAAVRYPGLYTLWLSPLCGRRVLYRMCARRVSRRARC